MSASPMRFIRQDIQSMHAYAIQDSVGHGQARRDGKPVYAVRHELQAELGARLGAVAINRYPGSRIDDLKKALADYIDLPARAGPDDRQRFRRADFPAGHGL